MSLPLLNIYKFCKEEIFDLTTPGEPREQQLGEVRTKKVELKKFHKTQNYWKGSIYEYFSKMRKKVQNEVTETEKRSFWLIYLKTFKKFTFLGPVTSILTFLQFSKKCAGVCISTLPVILFFMNFFVAQTSRTRFFFNCC